MSVPFIHLDSVTPFRVDFQGSFAMNSLRRGYLSMLDNSYVAASRIATAAFATVLLIGAAVEPARAQSLESSAANRNRIAASVAQNSGYQTLYVNPDTGSDRAEGIAERPLQTVTHALELAAPNTVIVLAPGKYTQATGEVFPLRLKPGVTIQGTPGSRDRTAIIEGGGTFNSPSRSQQNAAIVAADRAGIAQVAISNPDGYGVWIEAASPTILESAFVGNRQTGIYVTDGSPRVEGSYFSGNRVAGLVVFGTSNANIERNTFDGTGDAIRVIDGATPQITGNRMTNNNAGLVVIGNARPRLRDNQMEGNRRNDVVEVAARDQTRDQSIAAIPTLVESTTAEQTEPAIAPAVLTADVASAGAIAPVESTPAASASIAPDENADIVPGDRLGLTTPDSRVIEPTAPPDIRARLEQAQARAEQTQADEIQADEIQAEQKQEQIAVQPALPAISPQPETEADAVPDAIILAGSPGAALAALQAGLPNREPTPIVILASRASSGGNSPVRSPRIRREPEADRREDIREDARPDIQPDARPDAQPDISRPIINNRLAVPSSSIPIGSGSSATIFSPPSGGGGGIGSPPAPPSRAQALGLYYRVFVDASDPFVQDGVREVVPDSFRTQFEDRTVMQVGAFPTEEEAEKRQQLLERNDFDARVEYIR